MGDTIRQIARTALLCGTLGLLLYLALTFVVERPGLAPLLPPVLTLVASVVAISLTGKSLILACRTGEFPSKGRVITKEREPAWFWGFMIWYGAVALCLLVLVQYSLSLLIDVWNSMSDDDLGQLRARLLRQKSQ